MADDLQDYAILQTAGINPDDALLEGIKTYAEFPKNKDWISQKLHVILRSPNLPEKSAYDAADTSQ